VQCNCAWRIELGLCETASSWLAIVREQRTGVTLQEITTNLLNVVSSVLTSFSRIISPCGWNSLFLQMRFLLSGIDMPCSFCWCSSCIFGWHVINGPGSSVTFWIVTSPTNWSSFLYYLCNSLSDEPLSKSSVRELKLHDWCHLQCWGHTPHLQTKAHTAVFVRPKQKRSRSTWDKVICYVTLLLYACRFPLCTVALINFQKHQTVWNITPWQIIKI
jgi:hypothetical protein